MQNDLYGGGKRLQSNSSACSIDLLWTIASLSTRPKTTEHIAKSNDVNIAHLYRYFFADIDR